MKAYYLPLVLLSLFLGDSCNSGKENKDTDDGLTFSTDFESGSIGTISKLKDNLWSLSLKDDNNDTSLPDSFRTWFNVKVSGIGADGVQLQFTRLGFPYYFVPVYSLNGTDWKHFPEASVKQINNTTIEVAVPGEHSTVWIARTFPYTTKDYLEYRNTIVSNPFISIRSLGKSPDKSFPIDLITIEDKTRHSAKKHIWIHARTHSAEVGSSYLLEGLINTVVSDDAIGHALRTNYIFKIVPMHNADGILLGNYRTNASSINLENQWEFEKTANPLFLKDVAPIENRFLNRGAMAPLLIDKKDPVVLALNLHSSNSKPETHAFFFPHFGSGSGYTQEEQQLWGNQIAFIQSVAEHYEGRIEPPPLEGGKGFLNSYFPETWFWYNRKEKVTAITLETTYSKAGFDHWVTPKEWRELGVAVAKAIGDMKKARLQKVGDRSAFRLKQSTMTMEELEQLHLNH
ncbi:MAG TPA: M14-type cytosolic carboxypeptidase [Flavobacterium sp.]|nr:M14-type cytosolic carboxypeptidase [Flavobacterium sp.]